jgi:hypothetical protein
MNRNGGRRESVQKEGISFVSMSRSALTSKSPSPLGIVVEVSSTLRVGCVVSLCRGKQYPCEICFLIIIVCERGCKWVRRLNHWRVKKINYFDSEVVTGKIVESFPLGEDGINLNIYNWTLLYIFSM